MTVLLFTISLASVYVVLQVLIVAEFLLFEKDNECAFRGEPARTRILLLKIFPFLAILLLVFQ